MLNFWENQRHCCNHLDIKFRRMQIKINRWWVFHRYTGNPDDDPYILTTKPKNVPLISLRNEEYIQILTKQEYVNNKWKLFWNDPSVCTASEANKIENVQQKSNNKKQNQRRRIKRRPLGELPLIDEYQTPIIAPVTDMPDLQDKADEEHPFFKIYEDSSDKENKGSEKVKSNKSNTQGRIKKIYSIVREDSSLNSLDFFERNLLASMITTPDRSKVYTYIFQRRDVNTRTYSNVFDKNDRSKTTVKWSRNNTSKFDYVGKSYSSEVLKDNQFIQQSINSNSTCDPILNKCEKADYDVSTLNGDRILLQKEIKTFGLKGWIKNCIKYESNNNFDEKSHFNSKAISPLSRHRAFLTLIQHADLFSKRNLVSDESNIH